MDEIRLAQAVSYEYLIIAGTALAALALVGCCALLLFKMHAERRDGLRQYRSKKKGFSDLLWWDTVIADGVVLLKNGALMASWVYTGPDETMMTAQERATLSDRLNAVFAPLDSGWTLHIDVIRSERPAYFAPGTSHFPNKVAAAIDYERERNFTSRGAIYGSQFVITATWLPPLAATQKFTSLMFTSDGQKKSDLQKTRDLLAVFQQKAANLESQLSVPFPDIHRLKNIKAVDAYGRTFWYSDQLAYLKFCLTGVHQPILLGEGTPLHLDTMLAEDFQPGVVPMLGKNYIRVITVEGITGATSPGLLAALAELSGTYRWNTRFIALERFEAEARMKKLRRFWTQKQRGFFAQLFNLPGAVNRDAVAMADEAEQALSDISQGSISFGCWTSEFVLMDDDYEALRDNAALLMKILRSAGLSPRDEDLNCMDAFMGSLPGHASENVRQSLISTMNLADLMPVYAPWRGDMKCPCPFKGYKGAPALMECVTGAVKNSSFWLNLHVGDLGHTLILGPTGSGKSTLLCTLAAQAQRYEGMTVVSFDKGLSMYTLCKACGGQHFTPGGAEGLAFCPLGSLEDSEDLAWASDWIQSMLQLNNVQPTPDMVNEISMTLQNMMAAHRMNPEGYRMTFSNFVAEVQNSMITDALRTYCADGALGSLLDAENDGLDHFGSMNVIEIEQLMNLGDKYCLPVLLYLFRRIEKALQGQPCFLILDEAWVMLGHPVFRAKIREWLKVLRKKNCAVILATQSLSDAANSGILDVLNESCPSKIFLPNPTATQEEQHKLYAGMGLNDAQIAVIAEGRQKRDYVYASATRSREFQLGLDPFQLAFVGVSDPASLAKVRELEEKFPDTWVDEWLKLKKVSWPEGFEFHRTAGAV